MEDHVRNSVEYFISLSYTLKSSLYKLRDLTHLKIAIDEDLIWVRGFLEAEIGSTAVLSLPTACRYYLHKAQLYLVGNRLPSLVEPSLLWTPIQRGLKVETPKQNFNYFGIQHQHSISLIPSAKEQPIDVAICSLDMLRFYVSIAPKVRLDSLMWCMFEIDQAIVIGEPVLPIRSQDYYIVDCFIIPAGFVIKYTNMVKLYKHSLSESNIYWYIISKENTIKRIPRSHFNSLSKGSVERTLDSIKIKNTI